MCKKYRDLKKHVVNLAKIQNAGEASHHMIYEQR